MGRTVNTLAVKEKVTDSLRLETETEMVVRLVKVKTGITIPYEDILACHRIGKNKDTNPFVLSVANRKPGSAWESITGGMRKGFQNDCNIFINYQLTQRRISISKEVKKAKQSHLIQKYSVDSNGKIWIKPLNYDGFKEVTSIQNLQKLINH